MNQRLHDHILPIVAWVVMCLPAGARAATVVARPGETVLAVVGQATFDPRVQTIRLPFSGPPPRVVYHRLAGRHHFYEFVGARLANRGVQHGTSGGAVLRFTVADKPHATVRLSFLLAYDAMPAIRLDGNSFTILPLGEAVEEPIPRRLAPEKNVPRPSFSPPSSPRPLPTQSISPRPMALTPAVLDRPYLDSTLCHLVVPYVGEAPRCSVPRFRTDPRWLFVDLEPATLGFEGVRFDLVADPTFTSWMLQPRPRKRQIRLYMRLKRAAVITIEMHRDEHELHLVASPS